MFKGSKAIILTIDNYHDHLPSVWSVFNLKNIYRKYLEQSWDERFDIGWILVFDPTKVKFNQV